MLNHFKIMKLLVACLIALSSLVTCNALADTVLVTGANRGIGLEFVKQYADRGYTVIATARKPQDAKELIELAGNNSKITIEKLDVTSDKDIQVLADKYRSVPIDILINNAGIYGNPEGQALGSFDFSLYEKIMSVNMLGPLKVTEAFVGNVKQSGQKKIITLASGLGSVSRSSRFPGHIFYKSSKAAILMAMGSIQAGLKREGVIVAMISPGVVRTKMLEDSGFKGPALSPQESVKAMLKNIDGLTTQVTAQAIQYDGSLIPW